MKWLATLALLLIPATSFANTPQDAANAFFKVYMQQHVLDIPSAKHRKPFKAVVTPGLYKLLEKGDAAEQLYAKKTNFSVPPLIEGDLFSSNVEGVSSYAIDKCKETADTALCAAKLTFKDAAPKKIKSAAHSVTWTDTIYLAQTKQGWKVEDIGYGATWAFGNHGRLADTLRSVIKDAQDQPQQ